MKLLHDSKVSTIYLNTVTNVVYKTLKEKQVNDYWLHRYKEFQKTAPVVQIIDKWNANTYRMKYVPGIIGTVERFTEPWREDYRGYWTKNNFINLHTTMADAWQSAMRMSKKEQDNNFWVCDDFRLRNMVVVKDKKGNISFKIIDPDSWIICDGFHGIDSYYQSQLKVALIIQRMLNV